MIHEKWRTMIRPGYKRKQVFKASIGGGIGAAILLAAGAVMPLNQLEVWGLSLFVGAGALIVWSMLPYRRMVQMENIPDELWINTKGDLVYAKNSQPILSIPQHAIDKCFYIDNSDVYGIAVTIKMPPMKKISVHDSGFNFKAFQHACVYQYGCDLFFPFFSKRSFQSLQEYRQG